MARTFYDSLGLNEDIELDLSMLEATGTLLHDESKNHSTATMNSALGVPLWQQIAAWNFGIYLNRGNPFLSMEQYYDIPAANCTDLNFTSGDYSLSIWFDWEVTDDDDQVIMGKYIVDDCGWEVYLSDWLGVRYLTVRHHHSAGATERTASYSTGWEYGEDHLWSYSRIGNTGYHYRDGLPIWTFSDTLIDPESSAACDWRLGCRFSEDDHWWKTKFHRPRAWSKALSADEHRLLYRLGKP